jgi:hypothetical protein
LENTCARKIPFSRLEEAKDKGEEVKIPQGNVTQDLGAGIMQQKSGTVALKDMNPFHERCLWGCNKLSKIGPKMRNILANAIFLI